MSLTDLTAGSSLRERKALQARIGLGVKMLTNAGYAMIGGTFFKAVIDLRAIPATSYLWAGAGLAALGFALFFAPDAQSDD